MQAEAKRFWFLIVRVILLNVWLVLAAAATRNRETNMMINNWNWSRYLWFALLALSRPLEGREKSHDACRIYQEKRQESEFVRERNGSRERGLEVRYRVGITGMAKIQCGNLTMPIRQTTSILTSSTC